MIQRIKTALLALSVLAVVALPAVMVTGTVFAGTGASKSAACEGIGLSGSQCGGNADRDIGDLVSTIVNVLSVIVGIIAVIMIIVAGLKYITGGGDANSVSGAKNTLIYAIVGLIIVALAQFIVKFVLQQVRQ